MNLFQSGNSIKDISVFGNPTGNKLDSLKELKLAGNQVSQFNIVHQFIRLFSRK
jgi:hypothetical protein